MNTLQQVAILKQQAVDLLLAERDRIDAELAILGQEKAPNNKRRGRPPNPKVETMPQNEPTSQPDTIRSASLLAL